MPDDYTPELAYVVDGTVIDLNDIQLVDYVLVRRDDYDNLAAAIYDTPLDDDYLSNLDLAARRLVDVRRTGKPAIPDPRTCR
jgi:hypothetical protein